MLLGFFCGCVNGLLIVVGYVVVEFIVEGVIYVCVDFVFDVFVVGFVLGVIG